MNGAEFGFVTPNNNRVKFFLPLNSVYRKINPAINRYGGLDSG